ncbi:MAG: hypothetical protein K9L24_00825 [Spirochaetia bacterium]|nr:hypothetical protein [Spirochaetia bacterium]MCF7945384.1 hypothetical protein [Spirochaetia bacterium]MCF7954075.1 hypothetical protein [Spirochaetales bacterium]
MVYKYTVTLVLVFFLFTGPLFAETNALSNGSALPSSEVEDESQTQELLTVDSVSGATTSEKSAADFRIHRTLGYLTMAGAAATGLLGWLAPGDFHAGVAVGTTGLAAVTTGLAIADFARDRSVPLAHVILTGLGTVGFAANLFIEPEESDDDGSEGSELHSILGAASVGSFAFGVSWVIAF